MNTQIPFYKFCHSQFSKSTSSRLCRSYVVKPKALRLLSAVIISACLGTVTGFSHQGGRRTLSLTNLDVSNVGFKISEKEMILREMHRFAPRGFTQCVFWSDTECKHNSSEHLECCCCVILSLCALLTFCISFFCQV